MLSNIISKIIYFSKKNYWVSLSSKLNKGTVLEGYNKLFDKADVRDSFVGLGTYVGINSFLPKSKIGRFCTIGPSVSLIRGKHPAHNFVSIHPAFYSIRKQAGFTFVKKNKFDEFNNEKYAVEIGNDVWIGANVLILDGVKIGDGAIIGSGAVVSKDIQPYSINVGNPIKEIGFRFEKEEIEKLIKLKWWDWDIEKIKSSADYFENVKNITDRL